MKILLVTEKGCAEPLAAGVVNGDEAQLERIRELAAQLYAECQLLECESLSDIEWGLKEALEIA